MGDPIIPRLQQQKPGRNFVFTAIETLTTTDEVRQFADEYIAWQVAAGISDAASIAYNNIGYILGYYGDCEHALWYGTLADVSHPIFGPSFGRGGNPTPEEAFEMGRKWGKSTRGEVK